jgi:3-hydroxyacyl-[acyl-carrier-protein] dehydratase
MPNSLIIESIAQTGGILVGHINNFKYKVILAKIEKALFLKPVRPGDQLVLEAEILEEREEGYRVRGNGKVDGEEVANIQLMFLNLKDEGPWPKENFVFNKNFLSLFELQAQ